MDSNQNRRRRSITIGIAGLISCGVVVWPLLVLTQPMLIFNQDPGAKVFIDGQPVLFQGDTFTFYPWKTSYEVEIRTGKRTERRRIYPWREGSDSGSISVDKNGAKFHLESEEIE